MSNIEHQASLARYRSRGYKQVDGWLLPEAVELICSLAAIQERWGMDGAAAEIGIHHGKLFILLCLLAGPQGRGYAYDLFGQQEENPERSGWGDCQRFLSNLDRHGCSRDRVAIHEGNSLELTAEAIHQQMGRSVRLFSVDGGHSAENTYHDISLACAGLCRGGILILDDYFNQDWPAVSEGVMRYLIDHPGTLFPIVIGGNKLLLTNDEVRARAYRESLAAAWRPWHYKHSEFLGSPVFIVSNQDRVGRYLKHSALGRRLRGSKGVERLRQLQRRLKGS